MLMDHLGSTFRILRKERGYTLKTMSQDIISYSYLSKFEKDESDISMYNFIQLIERLNMTTDEFLFYNNIHTRKYQDLFYNISTAYGKNDYLELQRYMQEEKFLYEETGIIYRRCNSIMIAAIIQDIHKDFSISQSDVDFLVDYIMKCSFWTTYEVSLLGNTLTFFTEDSLLILMNEVHKRLNEYEVSHKNTRDLIRIIQNACIVLLRKQKIKEAHDLLLSTEPYLKFDYYFEKTRKLFIDALLLIGEGKRTEGTKKAEQTIEVMKVMDMNLAQDYQKELRNFLKRL